MRTKTFSFRRMISVMLTLLLLFTQAIPAVSAGEAVFSCRAAAEMLCVHADAYRSPPPTAEEILGDANPDAPLTRMAGCEMLLRAFGPLPDVQEGVRYLIKYRDCAFTDVPEAGRAAVENLTNAGLYIPEDNSVFGPNEPMTEHELSLLTDRIHAYLQSSPKDDFYSWSTAALLNDPGFQDISYDLVAYRSNMNDISRYQSWIMDTLNDCLEHPDTPENANIAAFFSTYMDHEARENSMTVIQPMIDSIWNALDFTELVNVCADICRETGIELLLRASYWNEWEDNYDYTTDGSRLYPAFKIGLFSGKADPNNYQPGAYTHDAYVEQKTRLLTCLGIGQDEAEAASANCMEGYGYEGQLQYNASEPGPYMIILDPENVPGELSFFPWAAYLERAGYPRSRPVAVYDPTEMAIALSVMSRSENLPGIKVSLVHRLIRSMTDVVPGVIRDRDIGYWDDFYAADPSAIFRWEDLIRFVLPMIQRDVYSRYAQSEEYSSVYERLSGYCRDILADYRDMLEQTSWLNETTRSKAIEKLDAMQYRLLITTNLSDYFQVDYVSAEEGGTLYENMIRYMKARREWIFSHENSPDEIAVESVLGYWWSTSACYFLGLNTFLLPLVCFVSNPFGPDTPNEELMARFAFVIAHEISHAFDSKGSRWNGKGEVEDWWTAEDRAEFTARCDRLASYLDGYEYFPGFVAEDGWQIANEVLADLTAMKCMMHIAARTQDFDYRKFFEAFADFWAISATRRGVVNYFMYNVHPTGRCRVNRLLSLIDEFYETYDIQPGDAMYVAPEDRPRVY